MKLKRLTVHKFRNVRPGTRLEFSPGMNVLLGPNGTGKTTLLNLIAMILRSDFSELDQESYSFEYSVESEWGRFDASIKYEPPERSLRRPLDASQPFALQTEPSKLLTDCTFTLPDDPSTILRVQSEYPLATITLTVHGQQLPPRQSHIPPSPTGALALTHIMAAHQTGGSNDLLPRFELAAATSPRQSRFDESLGFFDQMLATRPSFLSVDGVHVPLGPPLPAQLRSIFVEGLRASPPKTSYQASHQHLWFLDKAVSLTRFASGLLKAEMIEKAPHENGELIVLGNFTFAFTKKDGSYFNHSFLSYGQKRLLSFYYYLACFPHVVIADELVNGLHYVWIEDCLKEMEGRQAFLTSQNPLLLDHLHFDSAEQARESFILCRYEDEEQQGRVSWSNLTEDEADLFYRSYQVGIQHVSEILRTRGLW